MRSKRLAFFVGLFMLAAIIALLFLAFRVSGLTHMSKSDYYTVTAEFDNIGGLKVRAPVRLAGVSIGRVAKISLDPQSFRAQVTLLINKKDNNLPLDTSAGIMTEGLLGANYVSLTPGFDTQALKAGGVIQTTRSALILENLIGQLLFNLKSNKSQ